MKRQDTQVSISGGLHIDEEMAFPLFSGLIVGARLLSLAGSRRRSVQEELIKCLQLMKMKRNFGEIPSFNCLSNLF